MTILKRLFDSHVVDIYERNGKIIIRELCDGVAELELTNKEFRLLIQELQQLAEENSEPNK